jgi:flavodoxin
MEVRTMRRAVVVFESMFGNTLAIANAIAVGLSDHVPVDVIEVGKIGSSLPEDVELLVVGGPTQAFGMSRKSTREGAEKKAPGGVVSKGPGIREWLDALQSPGGNVAAAAFDTRFTKPTWLTGSAARGAERRLRRLGLRVVAPAESFFVSGTTGPLIEGERERARSWGETLASAVPAIRETV